MTLESGDLLAVSQPVTGESKHMPVLLLPKDPSNLLEGFDDFVRPLVTKPAKVLEDVQSGQNLFDAELPFKTEILPRVITSKPDSNDIKLISFKTPKAGRADYLLPIFFKLKDKAGTRMSAIMTKGSGSIEALKSYGSPFSHGLSERTAGEIEGAATINDLRLDAANSKILIDADIRTRVALGVYNLQEIEYEGKVYNPQQLIDAGIVKKPEDLPAIGVFASRTALRLEDINMLLRYNRNLDSPQIESLITYLVRTTEHDEGLEFTNFSQKYKGREVTAMSPEARKEVMSDFALALSRVLGRQAAKFEKINAIKKYENLYGTQYEDSANNVTCLAESVDNSELIFGVDVGKMHTYQESLRKMVDSLIRELKIDIDQLNHAVIKTRRSFISGYLAEISPGWDKETIPEDFLQGESFENDVDVIDIQNIYGLVKVYQSKMPKQMTRSNAINHLLMLSEGILPSILGDHPSNPKKTMRFLNHYLDRIGRKSD